MPRGTSLSAKEQGIIIGMHESGSKISEIASRLKRQRNCILKFLKKSTNYGTVRHSERKSNIDERYKRMIRGLAVADSMSSGQIQTKLRLQIKRNT